MANDKPHVNMTFAQLEEAAPTPEQYVFVLKGGKRVTFPDMYDKEVEEAEKFVDAMELAKNELGALKKWLPADDFAAYRDAKLTLRMHLNLMEDVMAYYKQTLGLSDK